MKHHACAMAWLGLVASPFLGGCATLLNGVRQPVEITADDPRAKVSFNGGPSRPAPATESLLRGRAGQSIEIIIPGSGQDSLESGDTLLIPLNRELSHVIWLNVAGGPFAAIGAVFDFATGSAWRLEPKAPWEIPHTVKVSTDADPWGTGDWRVAFSFFGGVKRYAHDVHPHGNRRDDGGFQLVLGRSEWPVQMELRRYVESSLSPIAFVHGDAGVRKTFFLHSRAKPYVGAGLSLLNRSTQIDGGFPVGIWGRGGVDLRLGSRILIAPYAGFTKHELASSVEGRNTLGTVYGVNYGLLW